MYRLPFALDSNFHVVFSVSELGLLEKEHSLTLVEDLGVDRKILHDCREMV